MGFHSQRHGLFARQLLIERSPLATTFRGFQHRVVRSTISWAREGEVIPIENCDRNTIREREMKIWNDGYVETDDAKEEIYRK